MRRPQVVHMEGLAIIYDRPPTNDVGRIRGHGSKTEWGAPTAYCCCLLGDDDPRASTALLSARLGAVANRDAAEHVGERG